MVIYRIVYFGVVFDLFFFNEIILVRTYFQSPIAIWSISCLSSSVCGFKVGIISILFFPSTYGHLSLRSRST